MRIAIVFLAGCGLVTDFDRELEDDDPDASIDAMVFPDAQLDASTDVPVDVPVDVVVDVPIDSGADAFDAGPCEGVVGEVVVGPLPELIEGGAAEAYTVVLSQEPSAPVTVFITSDGESIADAFVEFGTDDWDEPQAIMLEAVFDFEREGPHETQLRHSISSTDACYAASETVDATTSIRDRAHLTRISITLDGERARQNLPSVSDDGRFVVFEAAGSNLVAGDTNLTHDVFLRDTVMNTTVMMSQSTSGNPGDGESRRPTISADGSVVVFASRASNLVSPAPLPNHRELYTYETDTGRVTRITTDCTPSCPDSSATGSSVSLSADGEWIAYETKRRLVAEDTDNFLDVYLFQRSTGETMLASVVDGDTGTVPAGSNGDSMAASLSRDGRYLVFASKVAGWFNPAMPAGNVFAVLRDLETDTAERVSALHGSTDPCVGDTGTAGTRISTSGDRLMLSISCPMTFASGIPDTNDRGDIVARDLRTLSNDRVTVTATGAELATGNTAAAAMSDDGTLILWRTNQAGIVDGDTNGVMDAFLYDTTTNTNERVSLGCEYDELPSGISLHAIAMSRNAQFVVFQTTVALAEDDTNGESDMYMLQRF